MSARADSHGECLRGCDFDGIRVSEVAMPAGLELRRHLHSSGQVVFVLEGSYREYWRRERALLSPGSILYRPPGEPHTNRFGEAEVLALVVAYERERLAGLAPLGRPVRLPTILADLRERMIVELGRHDAASAHALEGLALLLLARVERVGSPARWPEWLREALSVIDSRFGEPISLSSVATAVEVHRATLAAGFRRYLDRSVGEVIREVRVRHALEALRRTRRPLAEIAIAAGFCDQPHMGRQVKRVTGLTPAEVRARR